MYVNETVWFRKMLLGMECEGIWQHSFKIALPTWISAGQILGLLLPGVFELYPSGATVTCHCPWSSLSLLVPCVYMDTSFIPNLRSLSRHGKKDTLSQRIYLLFKQRLPSSLITSVGASAFQLGHKEAPLPLLSVLLPLPWINRKKETVLPSCFYSWVCHWVSPA